MAESSFTTELFKDIDSKFWKEGRLATFENWPFSENQTCNPESMAAAGFFAVGGKDEPDLAECFMCSKQLDGWEPEDDPWEEHKKHQPNCPFVLVGKTNERQMTIREMFILMEKFYKRKIANDMEKAIEDVKKDWKSTADSIPELYELRKNQKTVD